MKKRTAALLVAALVGIGLLVWNDPVVQRVVAHTDGDRAVADVFARAICERDADQLAAHAGGTLARPASDWRQLTDTLVACSGVRFLGSLDTARGPEYVYALTILGKDEWFVLTVVGGKVVKVQ